MAAEGYYKVNLLEPTIFKDKFVGKSAIVIGTGMSTKKLVKYKDRLNDKFDVVIGLNFSTIDFEKQMTHHLILEKNPIRSYEDMRKNPGYRRDLPRILNWKSLHRFPKDINIIKATRSQFNGSPNIREYSYADDDGFMNGPIDKNGFSIGSVGLHGLHLACIMGCDKVYLSGMDLVFGEKFDHYYEDRYYRDNRKEIHKSPVVGVKHKGKSRETSDFFRSSAKFIDKVITTMCKPAGIEVYSFSDGLLTAPAKLDIDKFFEE